MQNSGNVTSKLCHFLFKALRAESVDPDESGDYDPLIWICALGNLNYFRFLALNGLNRKYFYVESVHNMILTF